MIHFDYLRSARPAAVRRLLELRLPHRLRSPLFALGASGAIVLSAWIIEGVRYADAQRIEHQSLAQLNQSKRDLAKTKALFAHLERLVVLVKEVRTIQGSGAGEALQLAEIGNRLPPHVWLTSLENDEHGIALHGRAANLAMLSATVTGLANSSRPGTPALVRVSREQDAMKSPGMVYEIHLDEVK